MVGSNIQKKVLVVGYSLTGIAASKYFKNEGFDVYLTELSKKGDKDTTELEKLGINLEFGGHSDNFINGSSFAILSPSIPTSAPILKKLKDYKIDAMSDIEYCYRKNPKKFITITGTNGKTTTTMLTEHILNSEFKVKSCGNIGTSPFDYMNDNLDYFVVEASSFQLEYSSKISPKIAIFTNFTPDHIYFHGTLQNYFDAKAKMFFNMDSNSYAILNYDDLKLRDFGKKLKTNVIYFSTSTDCDICLKDDYIVFKGEKIIKKDDIPLCGNHNIQNVMSSIAVAKILKLKNSEIINMITTFKAPPHRCEFIRKIGKISFYNDSKATNPEASNVALSAFLGKDVCLIAGGRDKNTPLDEFCALINKNIKNVILIGEATERFEAELNKSGYFNIKKSDTMQNAIDEAIKLNPDIVLLSPACASFDMFTSFEHRGDVFREYVLSK